MSLYQSIVQSFLPPGQSELKSYLVRGAAGSLSFKIINTGLVLVSGILLARLLGAQNYGYYAYAMSLIQLMTIPTVMGLPQLVLREISAYYARKDYGRMRGLLIRANQFVFGMSVFLMVVAAAIATAFSGHLAPEGVQTFLISLLLLPLLGLTTLRLAVLRGLRYILSGLAPELLIKPVVFIFLLVAAFFMIGQEVTPQLAMVFQVAAAGFAFFIGAVFLVRSMPSQVKAMDAVYDTRLWFKSALPFMFLGAMQLVNQRTDIVMLGFFRPMEEVGIYRAVVQGATLVSFVLISANMVLAPIISGLYTRGKLNQLQRLVTISARGILYLTLPVVLFLLIGGHWVLSFLFGAEFGAGANALRILCAGQLVNAVTGSVSIILNMTGHEKYALRGVALAAGSNIALNLLLIPQFGIEGAAAATAASMAILNVLLCWWVYKHVGVVSLAFKRLAVHN